jgi:nicotinamidase-related amidase
MATGPHSHQTAIEVSELGPGSALMIVDMQYHGAHRDHGLLKTRIAAGESDAIEYFAERVETLVVPNLVLLEETFRQKGLEVVHVKAESLTRDGRDRGPAERRHGKHVPPGSREAAILDELAPLDNEVVVTKTCGGVFNCTNIDYVLRKLSIDTLVVGGVVTGSCVELAVRDAADRGYTVVLVEDATASWSAEMQAEAINRMRDRSAKVMSAAEVRRLAEDPPAPAHRNEHGAHDSGHAHRP